MGFVGATVKRGRATGPGGAPPGRRPVVPPRRRRGRRFPWQRVARIGLAVGLVGFGTLVFLGLQERAEPVAARVVDRADPDAVIESTGVELVQTADGQENFALSATRQATYDDGSVRFVEGVTLRVTEQPDRESFVVTGMEASVNDAHTDVTVSGEVQLTVSDGLVVRTGTLVYARGQSVVKMEDGTGPTTLRRSGLEASGRNPIYDGDRAIINLREAATVRLTGNDDRETVDIRSARAILAHAERYMHFDGGTVVLTGPMVLESEIATAHFGEEETALERLELRGSVRIRSTEPAPGGVREMSAAEITLEFEETARILERAILAGEAAIELVGSDGGRGARIDAATMDVTMTPGSGDVTELVAQDAVRLRLRGLRDAPNGSRHEIRAGTLKAPATPDAGLTSVRFEQAVEYREQRPATTTAGPVSRVIRAQRLEAGVEEGFGVLVEARFLGDVRLEDDTREATTDELFYDVLGGRVTLGSSGDAGLAPRLTDATSTIEAVTIELSRDGSTIEASGDVKSVLTPGGGDTEESTSGRIPTLLEQDRQVNVIADALRYDGDAGQTTYTGRARLWQGETSFEGDTLAVDDQTGNLTASGSVQTAIQLVRLSETTQRGEVSLTLAEAETFVYDDAARRATYNTRALLRSEHGDLKADVIEVFLETDGRTLDRLEATGHVQLRLDGRWVTGERLVYYEAEGRYDMEGTPVEIVEEVEPEETATTAPPRSGAAPPPPSCRSTRGRALTFYRSTNTVAVDGRAELRTQTTNGQCIPLTF